jgi:hypothetical protein
VMRRGHVPSSLGSPRRREAAGEAAGEVPATDLADFADSPSGLSSLSPFM